MKKIYIAGPMTGCPQFNVEAFKQAERALKGFGYEVLNPATAHGHNLEIMSGDEALPPEELAKVIRTDLDMLQSADRIYMLFGWEKSTGARAEHAVATWMDIEITYE